MAAQPGGQSSGQSGAQQQASAQQQANAQQQAGGQQQGSNSKQAQGGAQQGQGGSQQWRAMSQGQLRHTLQQAGFKDVTIVDATYVVQAQSPSGDQVMLFINPPEVSSAANASGGDTGGQSTTSHGGASRLQLPEVSPVGRGPGRLVSGHRTASPVVRPRETAVRQLWKSSEVS